MITREDQRELVIELCRFIEASEEPPSLTALAERAGLSPPHVRRVFERITGVTPRAYAAARRATRLRRELMSRSTITEAIYAAGYGSSGRFYEASDALLGMTPSRYRAGGAGLEIRFAIGESSLGPVLVAATDRGVCAIMLGDEPEALANDLERRFPRAELIGADGAFEDWVAQVVGLVEDPRRQIELPFDIRGTAFQQRVWRALTRIPLGETISYSELAHRVGAPRSARAVAQACGANPVAVAIPCHRVVRRDGGLGGYRWGIDRKRALLLRESRQVGGPTSPRS